ncbi:MAG: hypothetical protein Q8N18_25110 [Opitutaceae bacterium]|nr:hypothetical protein [Opitutaceae bacterium]
MSLPADSQSLAEQLRVKMVRLQQAQMPHESLALLVEWLFAPDSDPRQAAAVEFAKRHSMFDPGEDPASTQHPGDERFQPRLVVLEADGTKLNVGIRINAIVAGSVRFLQYPPLPPSLQEILGARVAEIAFGRAPQSDASGAPEST